MSEQIETPEALDALPSRSVLLSGGQQAYRKDDDGGWRTFYGDRYESDVMLSPVIVVQPLTVLFRPDAPTPTSAGQARREYHTDGRPLGCPHFDQPAPVGDSLAVSATEGQVWAALEEVWDDGNAVGLDGWTGPGRGAGDVDDYAVFARERVIRKVLARLGIEVTP